MQRGRYGCGDACLVVRSLDLERVAVDDASGQLNAVQQTFFCFKHDKSTGDDEQQRQRTYPNIIPCSE